MSEKISDMPAAAALTGTELVEVVQGGDNVKTTIQAIANLASGIGGSTGSLDNAILRANGTGGSTLQSSTVVIDDFGTMAVGSVSPTLPSKFLDVGIANNGNTLDCPFRVYHDGLEGVGVGSGIEFAARTSGSNDEIGAVIGTQATDVTSTSEDFDFIIKTMAAGAPASERLKINANGITVTGQLNIAALNTAPSSASDTGTTGEIRIDANFIYVCVAANTWKRVAIATW